MTHEIDEARSVVKIGEGGRIVNPVYFPPDKLIYTAPRSEFIRLNSKDNVRTRSLFNGVALEYLYTHLISPWFSQAFNASGHGSMLETIRDNYKKIIPVKQRQDMDDGRSLDTDSDACNIYMHYNRLFEHEKFVDSAPNYNPPDFYGDDHVTEDKGELGWLRKIRVLEEASRDIAPTYVYEDDGLIFPARYCFDVSFPVDGNEGIILRLRFGGMVKQRDGVNHHML